MVLGYSGILCWFTRWLYDTMYTLYIIHITYSYRLEGSKRRKLLIHVYLWSKLVYSPPPWSGIHDLIVGAVRKRKRTFIRHCSSYCVRLSKLWPETWTRPLLKLSSAFFRLETTSLHPAPCRILVGWKNCIDNTEMIKEWT